jgi:hypothetical protein
MCYGKRKKPSQGLLVDPAEGSKFMHSCYLRPQAGLLVAIVQESK